MVKTYSAKASELQPQWYLIGAEGQVLGRLASQIAQILRGKHKPTFTPHLQSGDFVIIINTDKITVTDKHLDQKSTIVTLSTLVVSRRGPCGRPWKGVFRSVP